MAFADRFRHFLHRGADTVGQRPPEGIDAFIASRQANLAALDDSQLERLTDAALTQIDREKTLREAQALHERWKVKPEPRARDTSQ